MSYGSHVVVSLWLVWAINDIRLNGSLVVLFRPGAPPQLAAPADAVAVHFPSADDEQLPEAEWTALLKDHPFPQAGAEPLWTTKSEALEWPHLAYLASRGLPEGRPLSRP